MACLKMQMMLRLSLVLALALPAGSALAQQGGDEESKESDEGSSSALDEPVVAGLDDEAEAAGGEEAAGKSDAAAGGGSGVAAGAEPAERPPVESMWQLHEPLRFYSAGPGGETGLVRVREAFGGPPMSMRLSLHGGFYESDGFLNYLDESDYSQSNVQGRLGLSFTPIEYLEAFIGLRSSSNKNSASQPGLLQTQGDLSFGAKGIYPVLPYLGLGLDAVVSFTNGIGDVGPAFDSTNFRTDLLLSFDARGLAPEVPLRAHLNAGFILENTDSLEGNRELTWVEQYALRVNGYHRVALGLGLDAPLPYADPVAISPFIEYTVEIPIGVSNSDLEESSLGEDAGLANVIPMRLTPGVRVSYLDYITLDVAVDVGLGGEKAYIDGVPATPPWTVWLGLTYAFDPTGRGGPPAPVPAVLKGQVTDRSDGSPLGGATITFSGGAAMPVASGFEQGRYRAEHDAEVKLLAVCAKEGYASESHEVKLVRGEPATLDFSLEPEPEEPPPPTTGKVVGRVINAADQMPIPHAIISFNGAGLTPVATDELEGKYTTYELTPGVLELTASKEGYRPLQQEAEVKLGESAILDFALEPTAKMGTLAGKVTSHQDKPVEAEVALVGPKPAELKTTADTGEFSAEVPAGSYVVKVTADGYLTKARRFELEQDQSVMAEFKLSPRPKRRVVILQKNKNKIAVRRKIHFASGKTNLRADAHQILDGVIEVLVNHPEIKKLRIGGHTDSVGSRRLNQRLSQGRAESVMNYLTSQGIPPDKLEAKGYGEAKPIAPNSTRRGREQNRRVEFTIVEQE